MTKRELYDAKMGAALHGLADKYGCTIPYMATNATHLAEIGLEPEDVTKRMVAEARNCELELRNKIYAIADRINNPAPPAPATWGDRLVETAVWYMACEGWPLKKVLRTWAANAWPIAQPDIERWFQLGRAHGALPVPRWQLVVLESWF